MNTLFILLFSLFIPLIALPNEENSLIAYWSFDEENAYDYSGNRNNGTIVNDHIFIPGVSGSAIELYGISGNSDKGGHILLPNIDFENLDEFSINFWVKHKSNTNEGCYYIFFGDLFEGFLGIGYHVDRPNETYLMNHQWAVGAYENEKIYLVEPIQQNNSLNDFYNKWINLTLVYKDGFLQAWYNDKLISKIEQKIKISGKNAAINRTWWGKNKTATRFTAQYDEVKIFSKALNECEIKKLNSKSCFDITRCNSTNSFEEKIHNNHYIFLNNSYYIDKTLQLTSNSKYEIGALWSKSKYDVSSDFTINSVFSISDGNNSHMLENSNPGADGLALVIQNQDYYQIGSFGGGIGYSGIRNSIALELDLFKNLENYNDPNGHHICLFSNGVNQIHSDHFKNKFDFFNIYNDLESGIDYNLELEYISKTHNLRFSLSENETGDIIISAEYQGVNIENILNLEENRFAYIGLTSATGNAYQKHTIKDFSICSDGGIKESFNELNDKTISGHLVNDEFFIKINPTDELSNIFLVNNNGKKMTNYHLDKVNNTIKINLDDIPSGAYYLNFELNSNLHQELIIKV